MDQLRRVDSLGIQEEKFSSCGWNTWDQMWGLERLNWNENEAKKVAEEDGGKRSVVKKQKQKHGNGFVDWSPEGKHKSSVEGFGEG